MNQAEQDYILSLEKRIAAIEALVFPQQHTGAGQQQIHANPNRKDVCQGPLLDTNSSFV
jgi:hypothetical protein